MPIVWIVTIPVRDTNQGELAALHQPMNRKYKFHDNDKLYFVSFATVNWLDLPGAGKYFHKKII